MKGPKKKKTQKKSYPPKKTKQKPNQSKKPHPTGNNQTRKTEKENFSEVIQQVNA